METQLCFWISFLAEGEQVGVGFEGAKTICRFGACKVASRAEKVGFEGAKTMCRFGACKVASRAEIYIYISLCLRSAMFSK